MFPYRLFVEWSQEDEAYIARVPALNVAADGEAPEEAVREAQIAGEGMLEALQANGRPVPASDIAADYSGQLRLRMPRGLHRDLVLLSSAEGVSLNQVMIEQLAGKSSAVVIDELRRRMSDLEIKVAEMEAAAGDDEAPAPSVHANP